MTTVTMLIYNHKYAYSVASEMTCRREETLSDIASDKMDRALTEIMSYTPETIEDVIEIATHLKWCVANRIGDADEAMLTSFVYRYSPHFGSIQ